MQKVIAEIHLKKIINNAEYFKKRTGAKLCAVVKADAYGHGAEEVTLALSQTADCFAVAIVDEALKIRLSACGKDILIFTPPLDEAEIVTSAINGFTLTVSDLYTAKRIVETCRKYSLSVKVHLKVNTGMNRYGMQIQALGKTCKYLQNFYCVKVEGIYSHLYDFDIAVCEEQRTRFLRAILVAKGYFPNLCAHLSATYGAPLSKDYAFDMVRIGLGLYGYSPTPLPLQKAMTVRAPVIVNRAYQYGGAGYGKIDFVSMPKRLSTIRVGYADGFLRKKENGTDGKNANNLCMDACIRNEDLKRGEWVTLLSDADETSKKTGTIAYEVLCSATRRAERIYDYDD